MKYKCISDYIIEDVIIMKENDIVVTDGSKLYNISRNVDYININFEEIKSHLVSITDESKINTITDYDRFVNITNEMSDLFKRKNNDYGNSFEQSLDEEGIAVSRIRLGDKWRRFVALSRNKTQLVEDESVRDTLIDMANYAIMTIMWLDKQ